MKAVRAVWSHEFLRVLENFPAGRHDDEVDALSGAHQTLCERSGAINSASDIITGPIDPRFPVRVWAPRSPFRQPPTGPGSGTDPAFPWR